MPAAASNSRRGRFPLVLAFAIPAILAPILFAAFYAYTERPTSRYATYHAAAIAGAMDEGRWIPAFLPKSSRDIVETHDIDTNELEITFKYTPGDHGNVPLECRPTGNSVHFECDGWGLPISVFLEPSGTGRVLSRPHDT
jgi:hypothetical protein